MTSPERARHLPLLASDPAAVAKQRLDESSVRLVADSRMTYDRPDLPTPLTRDQVRQRRKRFVRPKTISLKRMPLYEQERNRMFYPYPDGVERPKTRGECCDGPRPCPFVSCKFHLYLDVSEKTGAIKLNFPDLEPDGLVESCALDVADREGTTLEAVGEIMNLTRERVRQVEEKALRKVGADVKLRESAGHGDDPDADGRFPLEPDTRSLEYFHWFGSPEGPNAPPESA